ncbi:MAG: DUF692 domain-containing protein [Gammaproteobacteria bacterium]|nr:DUF692 domain-containing protein [Gammaproteobacteria bacterium]
MLVGIAYRRELFEWIISCPEAVGCVEITAEHFFDTTGNILDDLRVNYPVFVHGLGLSLGTPGRLDQTYLNKFSEICHRVDAKWVSEHIAFTRTQDIDLGHLNPVPYNEQMLKVMHEHIDELSDQCQRPVILENITSHLSVPGTMPETEFINRLCETSGCGLLLDITNLFVNSRNHQFDPVDWLNQISPEYIIQTHVVGYSCISGQYEDYHSESIQPVLWKLIDQVLDYAKVQATILERDSNFPPVEELGFELGRLSSRVN